MGRTKVTPEIIDFIMANTGENTAIISELTGMSRGYITTTWKKHGYHARQVIRDAKKKRREEIVQYIKENYYKKTYPEMQEELGVSSGTISRCVKALKLKKNHSPRREEQSKNEILAGCDKRPEACFNCPLPDCILSTAIGCNDGETEFIKIGAVKTAGVPERAYNDVFKDWE